MKSKINYKRTLYGSVVIILLAGLITGCKKSSQTQGPNEVWIQNMAYSPASLTVTVNTTIKWTNIDGTNHTVSSDSGFYESGNIDGSGTYSRQFTATGTYPYHCNIHANMFGKIIVH